MQIGWGEEHMADSAGWFFWEQFNFPYQVFYCCDPFVFFFLLFLCRFFSSGMWAVLMIMKRLIWWHSSIKGRFSTVAVDPSKQDRSFWCGTKRITPIVLVSLSTASGTKSAPWAVKSEHDLYLLHESVLFCVVYLIAISFWWLPFYYCFYYFIGWLVGLSLDKCNHSL